MLCMMFKLGMTDEGRWERMRGLIRLRKAIGRVEFRDGIEVVVQSTAENDDS